MGSIPYLRRPSTLPFAKKRKCFGIRTDQTSLGGHEVNVRSLAHRDWSSILDCSEKHSALADEGDDGFETFARFKVAEHERALAALYFGIVCHHLERGADHRRQVNLVDDQQIRLGDARPALARYFFPGSDIDDIQREIRKFRRKGRRKVVAA